MMSWVGWLILLFFLCVFLNSLYNRQRCYRHGVFGHCRCCDEEEAAKIRTEAAARTSAERRRMQIEQIYSEMDEVERNELTAIVMARAEREHLLIRQGDLEAAVVRMYERTHGRVHS